MERQLILRPYKQTRKTGADLLIRNPRAIRKLPRTAQIEIQSLVVSQGTAFRLNIKDHTVELTDNPTGRAA
jgi:hypothetical protein